MAAEGQVVEGEGRDGGGLRGQEAGGVGVGQIGVRHGCWQHLDVQRDVLIAHVARVLDHHADVGGVEVRDDVGSHHMQEVARLQPHRPGDALVLPPIVEVPGKDVDPGTFRRVEHAHGQNVGAARDKRAPWVEREGSHATLVVAEVDAVEPHVGEVVDAPELQSHRLAGPGRRRGEVDAVPAVGRMSRRWRTHAAGHVGRLPRGGVEVRLLAPRSLLLQRGQRLGARVEAQRLAQHRGLEAPPGAEVQPGSRLIAEAGHRLPRLHGDAPAVHQLEPERGIEPGDVDARAAGAQPAKREQPDRDDEPRPPDGARQPTHLLFI